MVTCDYKKELGVVSVRNCGKTYRIGIYDGNCLAVFVRRYKDENDKRWSQLEFFYADMQHVRNMEKDCGVLPFDVVSIKLNMFYKKSKELLDVFVRNGFKVTCYYKEVKK